MATPRWQRYLERTSETECLQCSLHRYRHYVLSIPLRCLDLDRSRLASSSGTDLAAPQGDTSLPLQNNFKCVKIRPNLTPPQKNSLAAAPPPPQKKHDAGALIGLWINWVHLQKKIQQKHHLFVELCCGHLSSSIATTGAREAEYPLHRKKKCTPSQKKKCTKSGKGGENPGKIWKNIGQNWEREETIFEGSFTIPLLRVRAGYVSGCGVSYLPDYKHGWGDWGLLECK